MALLVWKSPYPVFGRSGVMRDTLYHQGDLGTVFTRTRSILVENTLERHIWSSYSRDDMRSD